MTDRPDILNEPGKWAIVPVEPTPELVGAWYRHKNGFHWYNEPAPEDTSDYGAYRAMLAASPSPTTLADIVGYVGELEGRLAEAERVIGRLIEVYGTMEDGDGEPCPDIAAARAWRDK